MEQKNITEMLCRVRQDLVYLSGFQCQHEPKCDDLIDPYGTGNKIPAEEARGACCNSCWTRRSAEDMLRHLREVTMLRDEMYKELKELSASCPIIEGDTALPAAAVERIVMKYFEGRVWGKE